MKKFLKWAGISLAAFIVIMVIVSAAVGGGNSNTTTPVSTPKVTNSTPADVPSASPSDTAPVMTTDQQQAVNSASNYLNDGQGFSRAGLLDQLTSSYGEGFSQSDAEFAVNYLKPDWNAQAVISAKNYLSDGQGFSRSGLLEQLTSSYGEGFTQAQAEYGVNQAMGS
jgi:hypothetical protein